jgi:hypothetical protein
MRDCKKCHIRIYGIGCGILEFEIREPFQMGVDLVKGGTCKFPRRGTDNLCRRVVNEKANQLTTGIAGGPDNRNFHRKNIRLLKI